MRQWVVKWAVGLWDSMKMSFCFRGVMKIAMYFMVSFVCVTIAICIYLGLGVVLRWNYMQ